MISGSLARADLALTTLYRTCNAMQTLVCVLLTALLLAGAVVVAALRRRVQALAAASERAHQLLAKNVERLNLALDGADEALWDWNVTKNRTYYSERWSQMLGFSPDEIGESVEIWERLVNPDDLAAAMDKLRIHIEGRSESYQAEFRMKTKDGDWRWIRARGKVVARAADGSVTRIAGTHIDITATKQAEEALAREQNLLRALVDSLPDYISAKDTGGRFLLVNKALAHILGVAAPSEALGKTDYDFYPAAVAARFRSDEQRVFETGEPSVGHEEPGRDAANRTWVLTTRAPIRNASGNVVGVVGTSRDITDLYKAQETIKANTRAKSEFLANMSHEIRTPLNGVIGMTGLLLDTDLSPEQREYAETVRMSGEVLLTVINDILDFSKIEAGKLQIESFPFDLRLVIEDVMEMVSPKAEERSLDLVLEYPPGLPCQFLGDAGRVRQIVTNLVGNAVKFTHQGYVLITVECESQEYGTAAMRVSVRDTGTGIPEDKLAAVFEKFSQADASTTRCYGGTGLGLTICKQLAALMSGTIGVRSRVGDGSTFWLTLPLTLDSQPHALPVAVDDLRGRRVLIVDDNDVNRRMLQEQITSWGMRNGSFASALQGLAEVRAAHASGDPYDFALLDYQMPEMDGAALAAALRADMDIRPPVVVLLTSVGHLSDICMLEGSAIDAFLTKPVRQSQLLNTLTTAWSKKVAAPGVNTASKTLKSPRTVLEEGRFESPPRVLVAEDNVVNQKVAVRMLEKLGFRVDVAANGREAITMFRMLPYDLIFMDCQMPEMDGYIATEEIRRLETLGQHVGIIAMTAEAMVGVREQCLAAGMDDYIAKPVKMESLLEAVRQWQSRGALNFTCS